MKRWVLGLLFLPSFAGGIFWYTQAPETPDGMYYDPGVRCSCNHLFVYRVNGGTISVENITHYSPRICGTVNPKADWAVTFSGAQNARLIEKKNHWVLLSDDGKYASKQARIPARYWWEKYGKPLAEKIRGRF